MTNIVSKSDPIRPKKFIKVGGIAILLGLAIHILANMVFKTFPSEDFTQIELQEYLTLEASNWAVVHGVRYLAIVCIIIFATALFLRTRDRAFSVATGWGIVGLLGTILMMSNLIIANGIEIVAFSDFHVHPNQEDSFWLLFYLSRVLFTAEMVAWAILIFGFSMAGYYSATIPKWLIILGVLSSITGLFSSVFIISIMKDGWAVIIIEIASLTGLLWFVCTGFTMLLQKK